jgi:hypothetical protein
MFKILLSVSLLLTAGTSGYMSVFGLMQVFSQYSVAVGAMGAGMELGKILIIVYLHRGWKTLRRSHKFYYSFVIFALVLITSLEVFGFLAQSYSQKGQETALISTRQGFLGQERDLIREELKILEKTLSGLPETYVSKRLQFRKESGYEGKRRRLLEINAELSKGADSEIRTRLAAGPVFAVGRLFHIQDTVAIIVFIILLVGVVEPLSVGLTVAVSNQWAVKPKGKMSPEHKERLQRELEGKQKGKKFKRGK